MELKWILLAVLTILLVRSNCTFMELKCPYSPIRCCESSCSNCTFMELKYVKQRRSVWSEIVLIVPLWNWNVWYKSLNVSKHVSSNCTFMELKWILQQRRKSKSSCSNCTFMELKCNKSKIKILLACVLIVPLWNWNNYGYNSYKDVESSNCTFMELKFSLSRRCTEHTMF